jgi:protein associated with RNAse G/E
LLFNGVLLREGDRFLELYISGRWFNIYEVHDKDSDAIKAWYCNITRPVKVEKEKLSYDDLALDMLIYPDRSILVLDEDEFASLSLDYADVQNARKGLKKLKEIFSRKKAFQMRDYKEFI